ncbi:transcriptional regulator, TetR family [Beutenbergia cavernae DSM 12333]|uniref:Transcriptional regulator, TetR family n=1 Tax=Beutenbergia cavernae (strain ATCC BAA-8 / DSM 12333 / CCUG 43141 / JCM 11478 / NBRC 16432 / NCIMB 13614 / HKI 0122) TaxID=471853 RepID=C5C1G0_BEUC1|nr:transcriptional regulator, TetR family [Beutenbergia cavernae DSM 12333]
MTRQPRADARRNRERVLAAAREAFAADGAAVPLDEIARRAGVGAGTVYRHFPSKEALFAAVIDDDVARLLADARELATSDDPGDAFLGYLRRLGEEAGARRDLADALAVAGFDAGPSFDTSAPSLQEALGVLLARAQAAGAVRADVGTRDLVALLKGALVAVGVADDDGVRERVFAVLTDGLRRG